MSAGPTDGERGPRRAQALQEQSGRSGMGGPPPALPHTGDLQVDDALEALVTVSSRPLEEQVEVYVGVHRKLQDRLADLDG